jgi:hypothetical protein
MTCSFHKLLKILPITGLHVSHPRLSGLDDTLFMISGNDLSCLILITENSSARDIRKWIQRWLETARPAAFISACNLEHETMKMTRLKETTSLEDVGNQRHTTSTSRSSFRLLLHFVDGLCSRPNAFPDVTFQHVLQNDNYISPSSYLKLRTWQLQI